eukprot:symbB.v1.2.028193.t1/scaffold2897.1/size67685/4
MTLHDAVPWQPKFTRRTVSFQLQEETPVLLGSTSLVSLQPPRWAARVEECVHKLTIVLVLLTISFL